MSDTTKASKKEEIKNLIQAEIDKMKADETYEESDEFFRNDRLILDKFKNELDFDYQFDTTDDEEAYILKATPVEINQYYIDVILPRI
jgi:hypothetical protein